MASETKPTETKKRPINRLQTVYAMRSYVSEVYKVAAEAAKEGRPVAWCVQEHFGSPFLNTMGVERVYPENYGPVSAASGAAPAMIDRSLAEGIPSYVCGYFQCAFGLGARMVELGMMPPEAPRGGMPKPNLFLAAVGGCDTKLKAFQAFGRYFNAPVWMMARPPFASGYREELKEGAYERRVDFFVNHLKEFVAFLEDVFGKKFDYDKFAEDVDLTMEMNAMAYEVGVELRMGIRPCPMNARDHFSTLYAGLFGAGDPAKVKDLYRNMRDEVLHRRENGISGINYPEKYRTSFNGLGPWHNMEILDRLAERGWNFVWEGYHPERPIDLSWVKDPIERWVRYRYRKCADEIDADFDPKEAAKIKQEIMEKGVSIKPSVVDARDHQLDGVVIQKVMSCRTISVGSTLQETRLMEAWKVPSLVTVCDMIDPRSFDIEDFMKRAEAFEEVMDHYKEVRRKEGLPW